jgi:NAD(P)-dependent dehydrogenase (short-subunit alcohol dehydrogenase family)
MGVNAKSQYFLAQAVCPIMKRQGGGRIINVASTGGRVGGFANSSIYSGTKGAIVMFSKSIAREVAADGILVNCIAPGVLDTDLRRNLPPERTKAIRDQIPLKRLGKPEEVAAFIAFLASDECSYCTGATFDINGGWVML